MRATLPAHENSRVSRVPSGSHAMLGPPMAAISLSPLIAHPALLVNACIADATNTFAYNQCLALIPTLNSTHARTPCRVHLMIVRTDALTIMPSIVTNKSMIVSH